MTDVRNLSVGQEVKSYRVMCELLGESEFVGSCYDKLKNIQLEDWKKYFDYERKGYKFIIKQIYSTPLKSDVQYLVPSLYNCKGIYKIQNGDEIYIGATDKSFRDSFYYHYKMKTLVRSNPNKVWYDDYSDMFTVLYIASGEEDLETIKVKYIEQYKDRFIDVNETLKANSCTVDEINIWKNTVSIPLVNKLNNGKYPNQDIFNKIYDEMQMLGWDISKAVKEFEFNHKQDIESRIISKAIINAVADNKDYRQMFIMACCKVINSNIRDLKEYIKQAKITISDYEKCKNELQEKYNIN